MFGRPTKGRGRALEECIDVLRRAWTGEPFEYQGRRVCVQPTPATPGGPVLLMGGGAEVVARRAARLGMGMVAQGGAPSLEAVYRAACDEYGTTPGLFVNPIGIPTSCFVAEDPDRAWHELGPYLLHDAKRDRGRRDGHQEPGLERRRASGGSRQLPDLHAGRGGRARAEQRRAPDPATLRGDPSRAGVAEPRADRHRGDPGIYATFALREVQSTPGSFRPRAAGAPSDRNLQLKPAVDLLLGQARRFGHELKRTGSSASSAGLDERGSVL
jgi:alkanesulfonate monooxygenase SsuD/methylene tetrahydromethanopterin reductase-like flavin-dependent oxidoreductase (luciferase family)